MNFDLLDRRIICLLQQNGRAPCAQIALQVGVSERTVRNRIKRLVQHKAIFPTVIVNPAQFGYQTAVDVFCEVELAQMEAVGFALSQLSEVSYIAYSTGDQDISIQALLESSEAVYQFLQRLSSIPGIRRTKTVLVPRILKNVYEWIPPKSAFKSKHEGEISVKATATKNGKESTQ